MVAIALLASAGIQFCATQKALYSELEELKKQTGDGIAECGADTQHSTKI